jgi:hypothetical protein
MVNLTAFAGYRSVQFVFPEGGYFLSDNGISTQYVPGPENWADSIPGDEQFYYDYG